MSATRPATEFSIGIMPRSASPELIAASASSKVGQGSGSASGQAATMAIWEFAPGSPWNAIFFGLVVVLIMAPCISRSGFCQYLTRGFEISRRIDAERHRIHDCGVDPHSGFQRPELFELLALFQNGRRQLDEALQRLPPIGVEPDVMVARAVAVRRGGTGEIQGPEPLVAQRGAHELHDAWGRVFLFLSDLRDQRSDVYS